MRKYCLIFLSFFAAAMAAVPRFVCAKVHSSRFSPGQFGRWKAISAPIKDQE